MERDALEDNARFEKRDVKVRLYAREVDDTMVMIMVLVVMTMIMDDGG